MTPRVLSLRKQVARIREVARKRLRGGENPRRVVQGISDSFDGLLRSFFADDLTSVGRYVALVAVGGYGRRELCPYSDIDLMFLCDDLERVGPTLERMVRDLWDAGIDLGHSVRSAAECLKYMKDDDITAATLLEARFLAGSENLMRRFEEKSLNRYRNQCKEVFARAKLESLRRSVEGEGRTIYVIEPHIKEGAGCMRDVQHVLWIERLRRKAQDFADIASHGGFSFEELRKLEEAYTFYLGVRCELHFATGLKQDILEMDAQLDVARNLGYVGSDDDDDERTGVERLLGEHYRHARAVRNFVRYYLETKSRGTKFIDKLRHRIFASRLDSDLSILNGHLYLAGDPEPKPDALEARILSIFQLTSDKDVDLSHSVREWVRRKLAEANIDFSRSAKTNRTFLKILRRGRKVGRILTRMHEVGLLGRIIPEFAQLESLVTLDGHHHFTVDEHTLRAVRRLDRIKANPDEKDRVFQPVLERIGDLLPLRIAALLHDIGKAEEGSHDAKGTKAAVVICERLGLDEETAAIVEFLIYRHLVMFKYSERMDFTEDSVIESFAKLVGTRANLDMLYVLTYIDIRSVGPKTWTIWKGAQLAELHEKTCIVLDTGKLPEADLGEKLEASGIDAKRRDAILEHCRQLDRPVYARETIPEQMIAHLEMVERQLETGVGQLDCEKLPGCYQLTICSADRSGLFADLAGLLVAEGLNILGARIYSRPDGVILDLFQVIPAVEVRVGIDQLVKSLRKKLQEVESGDTDVGELVASRTRRFGRAKPRSRPFFPPRVRVYDDKHSDATVLEVNAGDRYGLLYELSLTIAELGLDVQFARVSTMIDRARDVFHVVDRQSRGKVSNLVRLREIEHALMAAATREYPQESTRINS